MILQQSIFTLQSLDAIIQKTKDLIINWMAYAVDDINTIHHIETHKGPPIYPRSNIIPKPCVFDFCANIIKHQRLCWNVCEVRHMPNIFTAPVVRLIEGHPSNIINGSIVTNNWGTWRTSAINILRWSDGVYF